MFNVCFSTHCGRSNFSVNPCSCPHIQLYSGQERPMTKPMTLNVRVGGTLSDFVAANVGEHGAYDNVSEYVRDLIRKDKREAEELAIERLKAELQRAFAVSDAEYRHVSGADVIERNRVRRTRA